MKKIILLSVCIYLSVRPAIAQLGGFANKINNKVTNKAAQRADQKIDKKIDEALDAAEGKSPKPASTNNSNSATNNSTQTAGISDKSITSYSKFDFVPGDKIVYADDFTGDEIGQLPLHWNTQGKAELVNIEKQPGNWLRLFPTAVYLPGNKQTFTKNFTVEFDLLLDMKNTGYTYPYFSFGLLSSGDADPADNEFLKSYRSIQSAEIYVRLASGGTTGTYMESFDAGKKHFQSETQQLSNLENFYGKSTHVCIQVQESRLRVWFNGEKKFDLPRALPVAALFNNMFFRTFSSSYKEEELGFYISNIKVAAGVPDVRHKLLDEGKFSTTGILFDVNTAIIKPESNGVLKEMGDILSKNPGLSILIVGHTDNDGSDADNLSLSKKRAAAIKTALVKDFSIDESRINTDGKGESEPSGDNKTKEGRAANRRVEFLKQ
ncbi:OmpA family protein [Flavitalea sp.]|nr:OmpA family protein [Flavitalea sp.]